ncbi:hypothetical protein BCON_0144g00050 [Botryotinia convoluta]|uniref:Uncharacterized protein n=1 Tax=Botryotinia convoluta TaxID=54673 RepID=A0A4Z1HT49_9HELO|nr:hypothetical protein BCON_0144g00050 [Botryotinia convoluta]
MDADGSIAYISRKDASGIKKVPLVGAKTNQEHTNINQKLTGGLRCATNINKMCSKKRPTLNSAN